MPATPVNTQNSTGPSITVDEKVVVDQVQADTNFVHGDGLFPVKDPLTNGNLESNGKVVQNVTPDMSVLVTDLLGLSDGYTIGNRSLTGNAVGTVTLSAADPTNPRIDAITVAPAQEGGKNVNSKDGSGATYAAIAGTPAASPSKPAVPDGQILLAYVTVAAGVTSIVDADIDNSVKDFLCDIDELKSDLLARTSRNRTINRRQTVAIRDLEARIAILESMTGGGGGVATEIVEMPATDDDVKWDNAGASNIRVIGNSFKLTETVVPGTVQGLINDDFEFAGDGDAPDYSQLHFMNGAILDRATGNPPGPGTNDAILGGPNTTGGFSEAAYAAQYRVQSLGGTLPDNVEIASNYEASFSYKPGAPHNPGTLTDIFNEGVFDLSFYDYSGNWRGNLSLFAGGGEHRDAAGVWQFGDSGVSANMFFPDDTFPGTGGIFGNASDFRIDQSWDWIKTAGEVKVSARLSFTLGELEITAEEVGGSNTATAFTTFTPPANSAGLEIGRIEVYSYSATFVQDPQGNQFGSTDNVWIDDAFIQAKEPDVITTDTPGTITSKAITPVVANMVTASMSGRLIDRDGPQDTPYGTITVEYSEDAGVTWTAFDDRRQLVNLQPGDVTEQWQRTADAKDLDDIEASPDFRVRITMTSASGDRSPCISELYLGSDNSPAQADIQQIKQTLNSFLTEQSSGVPLLQIP